MTFDKRIYTKKERPKPLLLFDDPLKYLEGIENLNQTSKKSLISVTYTLFFLHFSHGPLRQVPHLMVILGSRPSFLAARVSLR